MPRVPGTLDDYAFTIHAAIDAWLATGTSTFIAWRSSWPTP
jgi:uncharacterized protein YyaL (SSP411 family)